MTDERLKALYARVCRLRPEDVTVWEGELPDGRGYTVTVFDDGEGESPFGASGPSPEGLRGQVGRQLEAANESFVAGMGRCQGPWWWPQDRDDATFRAVVREVLGEAPSAVAIELSEVDRGKFGDIVPWGNREKVEVRGGGPRPWRIRIFDAAGAYEAELCGRRGVWV